MARRRKPDPNQLELDFLGGKPPAGQSAAVPDMEIAAGAQPEPRAFSVAPEPFFLMADPFEPLVPMPGSSKRKPSEAGPAGSGQRADAQPDASLDFTVHAAPEPPQAEDDFCPAAPSADGALAQSDAAPAPPADPDAALTALAEDGDAYAQFELGNVYAHGRGGVPADAVLAARWYAAAAEQGHLQAQYEAGLLFADKASPVHDEGQAIRWLQTAANKGHKQALEYLFAGDADS
ncbi:MAG: sel1 repeat family protein [Duodenibacillus sp.]|nr:sel1 repeat family protein [Duodenibacillus sp.]